MPTFKAVIFDLDGTLLNSLRDLAESVNEALSLHSLSQHELEAYNFFVGDGFKNLARRALPKESQQDEELVEKILQTAKEIYRTRMDKHSRPYPQVDMLLQGLAQRNMRVSILSNKPDEQTKFLVKRFFPKHVFEWVFGARPQIHAIKPDPASALEICKLMQLEPKDFLFVGDTSTDMQTANNASMWPVGVLWGFRPRQELQANGARLLVEKPSQLLDFLDNAVL